MFNVHFGCIDPENKRKLVRNSVEIIWHLQDVTHAFIMRRMMEKIHLEKLGVWQKKVHRITDTEELPGIKMKKDIC